MQRWQISVTVDGLPPTKNEAKSLLAEGHPHAARVRALLEAAQKALAAGARPIEHGEVALEMVVVGPAQAPSDATNYLGGIGDVLQAKTAGVLVEHLGPLVQVSLFANDRQVRAITYREERGSTQMYRLTIRPLTGG
jgi:anti-sigma factor RsiW